MRKAIIEQVAQDFLAEKLEGLFEEVRKPDGEKYSQTEVVAGTRDVLTRVCLWKLRSGPITHPGLHLIRALAGFFAVEANYLS